MTKFDCTSCQDALADCLDAERQPTGDLAAHLAECTDCSAAWSQLQQAWSQLRPEGLALSAEAQARVLAYAAAHLPGAASRVEAAPSRPIGRWFWAAFALALALVIWKVGSVPEPMRAAPPEAGKVAQVDPAPAAERPPLPSAEASARAVSQEEAAAERPRAAAEVAAVDEKPAPQAGEGAPPPAAPLRAAEQTPSSKAKAELTKGGDEAPKMAASAASRAPRLREESAMEDALVGEAGAGADSVAGIAIAPDAEQAAAPAVRAAAPAGRAAEREARALAAAPVVVGGSQPASAPSLDQTTRSALDTLLRSAEPAENGWAQLRSAAAASSLRGFEALLASCGADTRLCDGAALGAGALRAASRRADATPLLQRAARSEVGAVAAAARRLLAGQ
jgi:hypothetical protein